MITIGRTKENYFVSSVVLLYYIPRTVSRFGKNAHDQRKRKRNAARKKTSIEELWKFAKVR